MMTFMWYKTEGEVRTGNMLCDKMTMDGEGTSVSVSEVHSPGPLHRRKRVISMFLPTPTTLGYQLLDDNVSKEYKLIDP